MFFIPSVEFHTLGDSMKLLLLMLVFLSLIGVLFSLKYWYSMDSEHVTNTKGTDNNHLHH